MFEEGLLTRVEARRYLGDISASTMDRLIRDGEIAFVRIRRRIIRFRPSDLERYLLNGLVAPCQDKEGGE